MNKHIHIHLPKGVSLGKTKDAGFTEADHKRDHGKFATTTGSAEHHDAAAAKHDETRQSLPSMHDDKHDHMKASMRHEEAAMYLRHADKAKAAGHHDLAAEHHKTAEMAAQQAKKHEAGLSTAQKAAGSGVEVKHQPGKTITHQPSQTGGKAGTGTETHHSMIKPGDSLHDKNGEKIDHVESVGKAMHAGERTIHTRAGYEHQTKGGHLQDGMHAQTSSYSPGAQATRSGPSKSELRMRQTSQELDRIQSEHAKRTGQALSRTAAANMRAGVK